MDVVTLPTSLGDVVARLILSAVLGGALGFNREVHNKPAGLRTHALVAVGACLFSSIGLALTSRGATLDSAAVSRIIQGVVAGIGFVGGGVILRGQSEKEIRGLTTAASILVVAGLGSATGLGLWRTAIAAALLALLILVIGGLMDRFIHKELNGEDDQD